EQLMEVDGILLTGAVAATHAGARLENGEIKVTWKATGRKGNAKIWLATANRIKEGGRDEYVLKATVPVGKEEAVIDAGGASGFYKVVIETPDNFLNRWIVVK